jgi:hypothetical protein
MVQYFREPLSITTFHLGSISLIMTVNWSELEGREVDTKLSPFSLQVVPFVPS